MQLASDGARDRLIENSWCDVGVCFMNNVSKAHGGRYSAPRNDMVIIVPPIKQYSISMTSL
jgi:hypothetical protein